MSRRGIAVVAAAFLALGSGCRGGDRPGGREVPAEAQALPPPAAAPLLQGWHAWAISHPEGVDALFAGPASDIWQGLLRRDPREAARLASERFGGPASAVPEAARLAAARAHLDWGTTLLAAWELDRLALASYHDWRSQAGARVLASRLLPWFAAAASVAPGSPAPAPPADLARDPRFAASQALIAAAGDTEALRERIEAVRWGEPDAVETLQPAGAGTPAVELALHDPRRFRALARAHLLRAKALAEGLPGPAAVLGTLAAAGAGEAPVRPASAGVASPPDLSAFFASDWPGPNEVLLSVEAGDLSPLPALATVRKALAAASPGAAWDGASTAAELDAALDRALALHGALVRELEASRGKALTEDDRAYAQAAVDAAVRGLAVDLLGRAGDGPPRRDRAAGPDDPAGLAMRLLQQTLPADAEADPFRASPTARLVLARACVQAGSAWRATALVAPLAAGPMPELAPVRETLAALDAAWTGGRTEGARSD